MNKEEEKNNQAYIGRDVLNFEMKALLPSGEFSKVSLSENMEKNKWTIIFFYPADFTFVCPTEIREMSQNFEKFSELNTDVISISTDKVHSHKAWVGSSLGKINFPMAEDPTGNVSKYFRVYWEETGVSQRGLFIIGPDGKLYSEYINFGAAGRSVVEVIRNLQAVQASFEGKMVPCNWQPGKDFIEKK